MSLAFCYSDAEQKLSELDIDKVVRYMVTDHKFNLQKLSVLIGKKKVLSGSNLNANTSACHCYTRLPFT